MPRRSLAAITTLPPILPRHIPPSPIALHNDRQRELWTSLIESRPVGYFDYAALILLAELVIHVDAYDTLTHQMEEKNVMALEDWGRLAACRDRESKACAMLCTRLRLSPQSRFSPAVAKTAAAAPQGEKPWEPSQSRRRAAPSQEVAS